MNLTEENGMTQTEGEPVRLTIEIDSDVYSKLTAIREKMGLRSTGLIVSQLLRELITQGNTGFPSIEDGEQEKSAGKD